MEKPHDHYRCVAPLRLLFLKETNNPTYQRLLTLMDHNEERREDLPTWKTYKTYVNDFLMYVFGLSLNVGSNGKLILKSHLCNTPTYKTLNLYLLH